MNGGTFDIKPVTDRKILEKRYKRGVDAILALVLFSGLNLALLLLNTDKYILFSTYISYYLGDYAMFYSGKYSAEYYAEFPDMQFYGNGFFALFTALAVGCILFYLLCWYKARKNNGTWLVYAFSFFCLDTVFMFLVTGFSVLNLLDNIKQLVLLVFLLMGSAAYKRLKEAKDEPQATVKAEAVAFSGTGEYSPVLREAGEEKTVMTFVQAELHSHHIVFRRTKRANELVVDEKVYAEYQIFSEKEHTLEAVIDGHKIKAVYDGKHMTYIYADGKLIAKKVRLI